MTLEEINALEGEALDREVAVTVLGLVPGPRVGTAGRSKVEVCRMALKLALGVE